MTRTAPIIAVAAATLVGAIALACVVGLVMLVARIIFGDGGWGVPLAVAIATYASWPASRLVWPTSGQPDIGQLAMIGIAQWAAIGGCMGLALSLAMVRLARRARPVEVTP